MNCRQIESSLPPFLDGDVDDTVARQVEMHLAECASCAEQARAGRVARDLLRARAAHLKETAPLGFRTRLEARLREEASPLDRLGWPGRVSVMAAAAALVIVTVGSLEFVPMPSAVLYAAQLAIDHVRCLYFEPGTIAPVAGTNIDEAVQAQHGWQVHVPPTSTSDDVTLLGVRRCPFTLGPHAHVLYRVAGRDVSLYITPGGERGEEEVHALGHVERIWSARGRSYGLVARGLAPPDLDRVESYFRASAQ
jgi:anti-sigma factor RsiW